MAAKRENRPDGLRERKTDELSQKLAVLTEEQFRLEFRRATESLSNPLQLRTIRRDIARIKTIRRRHPCMIER
jgi:large subunit ribosomal protein L29